MEDKKINYLEIINNPERIKKEYKDYNDLYMDIPVENSIPYNEEKKNEPR